jgi:hypothetical protein
MPTVDDFLGGVVRKPRKPGDFLRMANDTPQVAHPTKRTKQGNRPNLVPYWRPSGLGDCLEDGYALTKWTERGMIRGAALVGPSYNETAMHRLLVHDDADDAAAVNRTADNIAATWKGAAGLKDSADIGTFIHQVIEGGPLDMAEADRLGIRPGHIDVVRKEWAAFLDRYGFEVLAQELAVVNDVYGVAGTCDLVLRATRLVDEGDRRNAPIHPGDVIGADIKTGKLAVNADDSPTYWGTYPVQLAAYFCGSHVYDADAHAADVEAGIYTWGYDDPYRLTWFTALGVELRQDVALIVHVDAAKLLAGQRSDLISLVPVDLEVGRQGAALATAIREWRKLDGCGPAIGPAANKDARPVDDDSPSVVDLAEPTTATANPVAVVQNVTTPLDLDHQGTNAATDLHLTIADQRAAVATSPDEGADLNGDEYSPQWDALQARYKALDEASRAWINALSEQADHALVGFHSKGKRFKRRFEILRGLIHLAAAEGFDNDEQARNLAYSVTLDEALHWPAITAGHAIGSLDAAHAATFATLCAAAADGGVAAVVVDAKRIRYTLAA